MQKIVMKFVGLIAICSTWMLPIISPEIQAQETITQPSTTAPYTGFSIKELQSRRAAIEQMVDIDGAVKTDSLKFIDQAISYLEMADSGRQKDRELSQLTQTAPERMKILQDELKKPFMAPEIVEARAQQMSTSKLEQRLTQKEAEFATAQTRLREWSNRLAAEKAFNNQTANQSAAATSRLTEIQTQLETIADTTEADVLNHSRMLSLKSEWEKLTAEIKLTEMRQRSHGLLVELFSTEHDVARKAQESRQNMLKIWQAEVQRRRQQEAVETREDAQDAIGKVSLMPKVVQEQFAVNVQLGTDLEGIALEETELAEKYADYQTLLKVLEADFDTAKKRVEFTVLTEAIGLALRKQRLNLPSADQYLAGSEARQLRMSEISEKQIELEGLLRELSDPKNLVERVIISAGLLSDADRESLELNIQELVDNRLDIIQKLKSGYDRIFKFIQDIEYIEQKMFNTAKDFGELLDRHLLWIRSSKPVHLADLQLLKVSLG